MLVADGKNLLLIDKSSCLHIAIHIRSRPIALSFVFQQTLCIYLFIGNKDNAAVGQLIEIYWFDIVVRRRKHTIRHLGANRWCCTIHLHKTVSRVYNGTQINFSTLKDSRGT